MCLILLSFTEFTIQGNSIIKSGIHFLWLIHIALFSFVSVPELDVNFFLAQ